VPAKTFLKLLSTASFAAPLVAISFSALADDDDLQATAISPKVVLISLDGAKPDFIQRFIADGVLPANGGLAKLSKGVVSLRNTTASPSLTAVSHIAIATGSNSVHNDIPSNTYHNVAATIGTSASGFAASIGGYKLSPLGPSPDPSAEPLWVKLRQAGKTVVTATWPGADGADIKINGTTVQAAQPTRVVNYTVPFGAFGGLSATGFPLTAGQFSADPTVTAQINAAGHFSYSPVLATAPFETFTCSSAGTATCSSNSTPTATFDLKYEMRAAAFDTTNDGVVNYDTLVVFEKTLGIYPGHKKPPSTGPAYVKLGGSNAPFFFEGSGSKVGAAYFVSAMSPDLSTVRLVRYGSNFIPRNAPVIADVDDINNNVGFWRPQADFRIPERLSPGFTSFPDTELEAMYEDMVRTFVVYQSRVAERAILKNPGADLVMVYIEQPDGSGHQFLLTDPRQATNPTDPNTIGANQDSAKVARYRNYIHFAYQQADLAVKRIMQTAGPNSNVIVVSDHGFAPFHTAVSLTNLLKNAGVDTTKLGIRTSGPAANIYVNLQGRESGGTVDAATYNSLVTQVTNVLKTATDSNSTFNNTLDQKRVFTTVNSRPLSCPAGVGLCTSTRIGQDFGDIFALMDTGYNFDGIQSPGVARQGDAPFNSSTTVFSTPNFYGAHGHDPVLDDMSATFIARGPAFRNNKLVAGVRNIDVAPTILSILGVTPSPKVDGMVLKQVLR
jgi:predicted AlkP superfamily pyrophosphatase or phosphodiesterase